MLVDFEAQREWMRPMTGSTRTLEINAEVFEIARRTADLDKVDVPTLVESLVKRHAEYVEAFESPASGMPRFSLERYELQRDPAESDADYEARKSLFR